MRFDSEPIEAFIQHYAAETTHALFIIFDAKKKA